MYNILEITCWAFAWFSWRQPVLGANLEDSLVPLETNLNDLYVFGKRLNHMIEVVYFGFLFALWYLVYRHARLQQKVVWSEETMEKLLRTADTTTQKQHPAYGSHTEEDKIIMPNVKALLLRIEDLEADRIPDARHIATLQNKVAFLANMLLG